MAKGTAILKSLLGSCVGIAFYWPERKVSGLAHCLLPEPEKSSISFQISAKYVSQAIPSLMALLKIKPEHIKEIQVTVAGGGRMMETELHKNNMHIGQSNVQMAKNCLEKLGFKSIQYDVGGDHGRQICLDCSNGSVVIHKLSKSA